MAITAPWQRELRDSIRDPRRLAELLGLPAELAVRARAGASDFPVFVPPSYLRRIEPGNPSDPLLLQVWPAAAEADAPHGFTDDPVEDASFALRPGLLQKYAGRALMVVTGACAIHCRYCFRRHFPYHQAPPSEPVWDAAIDALGDDPAIEEIILSGGDPLTVTDARLARLAEQFAAVPHLRRLRIHTRLPVMIPSRVNDELLNWITGTRLTSVMVIHANHAQELDEEVAAALRRLTTAGVLLLNQAVLLRGVNDTVDAQAELNSRLIDLGVTPYYLHQLDRVRGAAHFEVSVERGREIIAELRRRLPGYAVPQYVQEQPGAAHKMVLA
ncbi:EF-P beta-lysylation protein EpmB [Lacipirellula limnantheis]|uniref:L-lysine 2,3-aminomutase n=1 Tax=Lacipirellula limnantheis TaxID=2528024 RepID=A0A517U5M7_9BACT|nr:EF-P beta-lysylation protein EpmB [Lacipirellula limnantheis]QDT75935.1 L-lysine 2,3-aminomutase [Lacipirellula limnantheis]